MAHAGWRSRGYIPHCDSGGLIQHVVFSTVGHKRDETGRNFGQLLLARPETASLMQDVLLHFDGDRYRIWAWCVMPNHVHVVAEQCEGWELARVVHAWKSFSANQINRVLGRNGAVWMREYFDRFMRNDDHLWTTIDYVENNPVEANLCATAADWRWSSARLRLHRGP